MRNAVEHITRRLSENALLPKLFRIIKKIMLAISDIWLRLFLENSSILNKMPILGQPPRSLSENRKSKHIMPTLLCSHEHKTLHRMSLKRQ